MLTLAFEHTDLFGQAVALGLQLFGAGLQGFAFGLEGAESIHIQEGLRVLAGLQTRDHGVQVFAEEKDIEHGGRL